MLRVQKKESVNGVRDKGRLKKRFVFSFCSFFPVFFPLLLPNFSLPLLLASSPSLLSQHPRENRPPPAREVLKLLRIPPPVRQSPRDQIGGGEEGKSERGQALAGNDAAAPLSFRSCCRRCCPRGEKRRQREAPPLRALGAVVGARHKREERRGRESVPAVFFGCFFFFFFSSSSSVSRRRPRRRRRLTCLLPPQGPQVRVRGEVQAPKQGPEAQGHAEEREVVKRR